jgi:hypothetical protein
MAALRKHERPFRVGFGLFALNDFWGGNVTQSGRLLVLICSAIWKVRAMSAKDGISDVGLQTQNSIRFDKLARPHRHK